MKETLFEIGKKFRLPGVVESYETIKNGIINMTFKVNYRTPDDSPKSYIFQKINLHVFKYPVDMMKNIDLVTTHIRDKYPSDPTLHFHHTENRDNYFFDASGSFWRVMNYIESVTFNSCHDLDMVRSTGSAFGRFQMQLADFDGSRLKETIPDFHNTKKRLDTLFAHVSQDPVKRVAAALPEIEYLSSVKEKAAELSLRFAKGEIPVRVTHNDTKCNNILFHPQTKKPLVIIDLDTVMPGMSLYDFGDAARFIANTAAEDEKDLSLVSLDPNLFRALAEGYVEQVKGHVTEEEITLLPLATFSITVELASRFLDDYLTGDRYFKISYPEHNLVRARCQIHLAKSILEQYDALCQIIQRLI